MPPCDCVEVTVYDVLTLQMSKEFFLSALASFGSRELTALCSLLDDDCFGFVDVPNSAIPGIVRLICMSLFVLPLSRDDCDKLAYRYDLF